MKLITEEVRIGIAGIVALCLPVFGINYPKGINTSKPASYFYVKFHNVDGLVQSSPVFADSVCVGIVRGVVYDYNQPENVIVEVEVDTDLRIPKGGSAESVPELMGGVRMNILLANNPRGRCVAGDTIPETLNNGMMEKVVAMILAAEKTLLKLDSTLTSLNTITADQSIPAILHSTEKMITNLEVTSRWLKVLMNNDILQLTGRLNIIGDSFIVISGNPKEIDYAATFKKIDATLSNAKMLTGKPNSKDNTVGLLPNDPQLYNNPNQTTINAVSLLEDLKEHPKRYVHFFLSGKKDKQVKPLKQNLSK